MSPIFRMTSATWCGARRKRRAIRNKLDYSLLLDGLVAEREQGITIDVAWRYLDTPKRRLVLIDSPAMTNTPATWRAAQATLTLR